MNRAGLDMIETDSLDKVKGLSLYPLIAEEYREPFKTLTKDVFNGKSGTLEFRMIGLKGRPLWLYTHAVPLRNEKGEIVSALATTLDITERKRAEDKLIHTYNLMQYIISHARSAIAVHDKDLKYIYVSEQYLREYKVKEHDVIGKHHYDVFPDLPQKWRDVHQRVLAGAVESQEEDPYVREDGSVVWTRWECRPWYATDGSIGGLIVYTEVINERKCREEALKESEEQFKALFENAADAIFVADMESGVIIDANKAASRLMLLPHDKIVGLKQSDLHPPQAAKYSRETFEKHKDAAERKIPTSPVENIILRSDGVEIPIEVLASMVTIKGKQFLMGTFRDISERRNAEKKVRESEEKLRAYLDNISDTIWLIDANLDMVYVSPSITRMLGISPEELIGHPSSLIIHPDDLDVVNDAQRHVLDHPGEPHSVQYRVRNKDDCWIHVESTGINMLANPAINGVLVTMRNITERKQAVEKLRESENRYRIFADQSIEALYLHEMTGEIIDVNETAVRDSGYSRAELLQMTVFDIDPALRGIENRVEIWDQLKSFEYQIFSANHKNKSGVFYPIEVRIGKVLLNGKIYMLALAKDITEQKKAEEALRESTERLNLALQSAHMGVWRWEISENRRYFDDLTCQLLGINSATFTGTPEEFFRAVHPEDREQIKSALARTIEKNVLYEPKYRVVWPDGSVHYMTARGRLVRDDRGQPARINGILWDITDQLLLEQERIKTQKIDSLGTLAGGIAHDFNNLLQGIFGYISMAKLSLEQKEKSLQMLEEAEKALHMSVNLTTQLLTFSKGGKPVKKMISLQPVIENSVKFALSGSNVDYRIMLDENLWTVEADEGQLGQVIQNIVLNADQAMPLGGTIRITAKNVQATKEELPQLLRYGKYVEISVNDSGIGISTQHLKKIFDPYFTTKKKGSGLGLATSYSIIKNHGGMISVVSKIGKGATFYIYLPVLVGRKEASHVSAPFTVGQKGKILLMDDDELVRNIAGELLKALEHEVDFAVRGEEAIRKYQTARESGKPFDIVILDLTIRGGMGGKETIEQLCAIDPGIKAVVSSGYSDDAIMSDYEKYGFKARLKKPYNLTELRNTLNALLSA